MSSKTRSMSRSIERFENDTIVRNAHKIGTKQFYDIPLTELCLDMSYQRARASTIEGLIKNWDMKKCEVIQVSYREGKFYIINGQHRFIAAGLNGETHLVAEIHTGLTQKDEAKLFIEQNKNAKPLTPYDTFNGNILIGDPTDTIIDILCKKYNIAISGVRGIKPPATLGSLSLARSVVKGSGAEGLDWILSIIKIANWTEETNAYGSFTIRPLYSLYINHKDELCEVKEIVSEIFSKTTPNNFKARAKTAFPERDEKAAVGAYLEVLVTNKLSELSSSKTIKASNPSISSTFTIKGRQKSQV